MSVTVKLPLKIKDEIMNITEKNNVVDGIKDLVRQELIRKKTKYLFMAMNYEKKYGMKFKDFERKNKGKEMDFETEKDYFDWDMAVTALEDISEEIKGV